jgi:hypothetical protein
MTVTHVVFSDFPGFIKANTLTEVSMSSEVIVLDLLTKKEKKRSTYNELRKEWSDNEGFLKRLREMLDDGLIYVKLKKTGTLSDEAYNKLKFEKE